MFCIKLAYTVSEDHIRVKLCKIILIYVFYLSEIILSVCLLVNNSACPLLIRKKSVTRHRKFRSKNYGTAATDGNAMISTPSIRQIGRLEENTVGMWCWLYNQIFKMTRNSIRKTFKTTQIIKTPTKNMSQLLVSPAWVIMNWPPPRLKTYSPSQAHSAVSTYSSFHLFACHTLIDLSTVKPTRWLGVWRRTQFATKLVGCGGAWAAMKEALTPPETGWKNENFRSLLILELIWQWWSAACDRPNAKYH